MKKKLFFDVDNTICNSTKRFVQIYNQIYNQEADWRECYKWDYSDICPLIQDSEEIFARPDFYNWQMEYQDVYIQTVISYLYNVGEFDIHFVTIGTKKNLKHKETWLEIRFPYIPKENYHLLEKTNMGKEEINMIDGILIDDNYINLLTSNADLKICMHKLTDWNKGVERSGFVRLTDSLQLHQYIRELEASGRFNG